MSLLQKKRDQFRKQIRRNQLEKYREKKRKALFHQQISFELLQKINDIFKDLEEFLSQTAFKRTSQHFMGMTSASFIDEPTSIKQVMECFQQLKTLAPYEFEQVFTKYMLEEKSAERIMRIFSDLITNQVENEDESDGEIQEKYNPIIRARTLLEILKFLDTLSYIVIGYDSILMVIEGLCKFWTDKLLFDEIQKFGYLNYTLSILCKLLEDSKNKIIYSYLEQKGIGSQIVKFIEKIQKVNVPFEIHENLLNLMNNYLACQLAYQPEVQDKIGEVTINTSTVNQKERMIAYCIDLLGKHQLSLYLVIFPVISKIIEIHEFLTSQLNEKYLTEISEFILHEDRNIQIEALNLLNDFTYHSQDCLDYLLEKGYLLDILQKRLAIERTANDENVNSCVEKISYIICNCLLTQKPNLKKFTLGHYIWQEIYMSFHPSSKLFPLILTMLYFLDANGHKNFQKYLIPYLQALKNFEWEQCKYSKQIERSIKNTFHNADQHWQEHQFKKFLRILHQYGFLEMVEDLCEPDVIQSVKEGQME